MLIDTNTYAGHWPFRMLKNNTVQEVCDNAEKNGITHVVIASLNAVFYKDPFDGNRELMEEIRACKTSVKILPLAVVNPTYTGWEKYARKAIEEDGFCGFEICPAYHGYTLLPSSNGYKRFYYAKEVMELAKEYDVPVRITTCFENCRQRHLMDLQYDLKADDICNLLSECPGVSVIITGTNPMVFGEKMKEYAKKYDNVFFEISKIEGYARDVMKKAAEALGPEHLCFGTLSPFHYVQPSMLKLRYVDEFKDKGIEDNVKRIFKNI